MSSPSASASASAPAPAPAPAPPAPPSSSPSAPPPPPSSPPDSTEPHLLSSLAHLQTLHLQLRHLRSTIPRLLAPFLTPAAHASPEDLYDAFRARAVGAGEEVERLREGWEGWVGGRVRMGDGEADKAVGKGEGEGEDVGNQEGGDGEEVGGVGSEEVGDLVGRWREGREGVEVEVGVDGREVEVYLPPPARIHFHISAISTPDQTTTFGVTCKEAAQVHKAIIRSVAARSRPYDLEYLLDMLASYKDVKERPCQQCGKLLDNRARFPVVRRRKRTKNDAGEFESTWEAVHESCS